MSVCVCVCVSRGGTQLYRAAAPRGEILCVPADECQCPGAVPVHAGGEQTAGPAGGAGDGQCPGVSSTPTTLPQPVTGPITTHGPPTPLGQPGHRTNPVRERGPGPHRHPRTLTSGGLRLFLSFHSDCPFAPSGELVAVLLVGGVLWCGLGIRPHEVMERGCIGCLLAGNNARGGAADLVLLSSCVYVLFCM